VNSLLDESREEHTVESSNEVDDFEEQSEADRAGQQKNQPVVPTDRLEKLKDFAHLVRNSPKKLLNQY
jgi:hypothetical protein